MNPQTALATARQLSQDLEKVLREAGSIETAQRLANDLPQLRAAIAAREIPIDVVSLPDGNQPDTPSAWFRAGQAGQGRPVPFVGSVGGLMPYYWDASTPPALRIGALQRPVLAVDQYSDSLDGVFDERPLAILGPSNSPGVSTRLPEWWHCDTTLLLERLLQPEGELLADTLLACSFAGTLEGISSAFGIALEQELRGLKAKKAMAVQRVSRVQQKPGTMMVTEVMSELRLRIQRQFSDFERGATDRIQDLTSPQTGTLARKLEVDLAAITTLEREDHSRTTSLCLPPATEAALLADLRENLTRHFLADLLAMRDLFRIIQQDVETFLEQRDGPPFLTQFQYLPDDRLYRLLDTAIVQQRHYQGEVPRGGFFEYAMSARRYLSLLLMFLSSFGLSFLRGYRAFMIPVSILVLAIGAIIVGNNVKKERKESTERELEKAREAIRTDWKRICVDAQRGWLNLIGQHMAEQTQQALYQAEAALREHAARRTGEASDEKQRIQRQLQVLETAEKKLQLAARGRDTVTRAISQIRGELKQLFLNNVRLVRKVGA